MNILLTTLNSKYIHTNLAIRYLKEFTRDLINCSMEEYTINNNLDYILKEIYKKEYDLIAFSTYIWNVDDTLKLCENIKKINPKIKILLGGPEVSFDSMNTMKKYDFIDYIICEEGEVIFREFVEYLLGKRDIKNINGILYRNEKEIVQNKPSDLLKNLDLIPSPYDNMDKSEYENKIVYYETSRGCPFNCQYCLSSTINGLRYFSIDRVKKDLKNLMDARVSQVKFIDRTFNANTEFAMDVMNFLMANDNGHTTFHFEVTAHLIDDEMLEFLSGCKEGLFQFEIGVQSTNKEALEAVGRKDDFDKLSYAVRKVSSFRNIHQHLDLIAGLPYEDYKSFGRSFNDVFNLGIEQVQLGFLKMIKGTGVRANANIHGYKYKDYPPYEILYNNYINYNEILKLKDIEEILEVYYNSKNFSLSIKYLISNYYKENPFRFFEEFSSYYDENGHFKVSQGKNQLYNILLDFYEYKISRNIDLFKEILKYDYVSLGKSPNIPKFIDKYELEDFKNRCHLFLQNEDNVEKYIPKFKNSAAKNIIKHVHFEVFKYNIINLKEEINKGLEKEITTVLFVYDNDKKVFEKSKSYVVQM